MSYPRNNPFTPGKQISSQGQNDLSTGQTWKDPVRMTTHLRPESSFSSPAASATPCMPEGGVTAQPSLPMSNRLETSGTVLTNISKSTMSICVREETRHQSDGQGAFFTSTQRDISSTTWVSSNSLSSTSQGHQGFSVCSGSSSLNWLPNYKNASKDSSKSTSNIFDSCDPAADQPVAPQLAVSILMNYGLDEEDLDELLNYPEEQTTAENLPHTLHKIRMKKTMRAPASVQSDHGSTSLPTSSASGMNRLDEIPQGSCQPSKVIDQGHAGKCFSENKIGETLCQTAKTDENMLMMDCIESKTHNEEVPQKELTEIRSSGMVSFDDEMDPVASLNLKDVVAPPSSHPTKLQASPNKTLHKIFTMLSLPSKYRDVSGPTPKVLKSVPSKEPVTYFASKSVPSSSLGQGVNSGESVLVQMGSSDSCTNGQTKIQRQGSNIKMLMKNQQMQHQIQPKLVHPPVVQMGQALQSAMSSIAKPDPPLSFIPTYSEASHPFLPSAFISNLNDPGSSIIQPFQPVLDLNSTYLPFSKQSSAKNPASKCLPPLAMMHDFAAVTPRVFSHTCSLCKTECEQMKDWIIHQNTNLHLENCKRLREQYPEWGGELPLPSAAGRSAKSSPSTSGLRSKNYHQKAKRESRSRSRSYSPCPRRSRNGQKNSRSSSRSCSYSPRRRSSTDGRFKSNSSRSRSSSYSPRRRSSRDERNKSSSSSCTRSYSPRRHSHSEREKENHGNGPRSLHSTRPIDRSRSSSDERRSSPKRKYRKLLSPRGSPEPRWSPRRTLKRWGRSLEQQLSPRSDRKRRSPKSSHEKYLSPRGSQEQHLPPKRLDDKRWSPTKRHEQQSSPRRTDEKRWSPARSRERQSSPTTNYEKRSSPKRSHERVLSARRNDDKQWSPTSCKQQSPSRRDEEKHLQPNKSGDDSSLKRSHKRRASLEESYHKKSSCSVETLTDRLLENPVVQSLSGQPDIKDMVKLMIPVVMAELANSTASSSVPSSSLDKKRKSGKEQPKLQRTEINSSSKHKLDKPSPPTMVKLKGVFDSLSRNDVVAAVELFGKTKSVLMMRFKQEATICFEKKEDAEKLRSAKNLDVKGVTITVVTKKGSDCETSSSTEDQKKPTQQKSALTRKSASENLVLLPIKSLISLPKRPKNSTAVKLVKKAKILSPKEKDASIKQVDNTVKTGNVAVRTVEGIKTSKPLGLRKFKSPKKTAGSGESQQKAATSNTKRKGEDSDVELNKNTKVKKTSRATVAKPIKVKSIVTMTKSHSSKSDKTLKRVTEKRRNLVKAAKRSAKGKEGNVSERKILRSKSKKRWLPSSKEVEETSRNMQPSECSTSENQPDDSGAFKAENLEAEVEEYPAECEDTAKVNGTRIVTFSEINQQLEVEVDTETKQVKETETLKHEKTGVAEQTDVKGSAEDEPLAQASQTLPTTITTPETVKDSPQDQLSSKLESDCDAKQPTTSKNALQQRTTESVALEAVQIDMKVDTETNQKEETAAVTKTNQNQVLKPLTAAAATETNPNLTTAVSSKELFPAFMTVGENIKWYLSPAKFMCAMVETILQPARFRDDTLLLITNLPRIDSYTETDVVNLLANFGFEYEHDNIYVIPQSFMAFVLMPNQHAVMNIIRVSLRHHLILKNKPLFLHIVRKNISMNPLGFYKSLMEQTPFNLTIDGTSLIYIRNISPSEASDLKEALRKIGSVANYLPLLNKVFIEFHSMHDADRLGVWYSFLKHSVCHIVERIKLPRSPKKSKPPQLPMNALPDIKLIKPGAEIPNAKYGIPQGTTPPFWITMTTMPYVFSTASPWFNIPDFLTLQGKNEPFITYHLGSGYCTVMLTGLPEGNYRHEDVAKLVWRYFPKQNLQTLYYNILVLPLQRRAFVYFCSREACCSFVRDHYKKPVSVGNRPLQVHFIVQDIRHESSEAMMYRTLMKWSNTHMSEIDFLEKRLLCVEISEISVDLVKKVMTEVASISCFVNFLPLANRICIEMVESSGVRKVLDEISLKGDLSTHKTWSKVLHVESVKDLKQRLKDSSEVTVNLEMNVSQVSAKPRAVKTGTRVDSDKPAKSAESTISKSEAVFKERAAEPPNTSKSWDKPEDRAPEHPITSKYEANPEEKATKPLEVYETENKQKEARVPENVKASKPKINPDKEATKPSDVSKSVNKPDERTPETSKATKPDKQVAKPANASTLSEETDAKSTTVSESEDRKQERDPRTIKASQPEVKPDKPTAKPSNVSKPQIKPGAAPGPSKASQTEIKIDKPAPNLSNVSTSDIQPEENDAKPPTVSKSENKQEEDKAPDPPKMSVPGIKTDKAATKPSNVSKPEIKPEEKITEPPKCVLASKAETVSVTPPHQSFKDTSAAAGPGSAVKTQIVSASNAVSNISTSTADGSAVKKPPAAATTSATPLTFGERIESLLLPQKIPCLAKNVVMSAKSFSLHARLLLITNLPDRRNRCYTERDLVKLLQTFGFQYEDKNIYILPLACLAFVLMPTFPRAKDVFVASRRKCLTFLGSQLVVQIISKEIFMTPFGFYISLLKEINYKVTDDGTNTIYISNISPEEAKNLRETLKKIKSVKNYLPLLNKVFIEFESSRDADRIGVWYSLLKHCPTHNIFRMKIPRSSTNATAPRLAANALPDSKDMVAGAIAPTTNFGVPQGSTPPFSVTLTTHPFIFPTSSPWFIIPAFITIETKKSLWTSVSVASELSTVMLTGLPEGNYRHEDVAKLVWRYFPKQNLQTLFYNIMVLPLQRRAFVYFNDWKSCSSFLEDSISNPVSVKDHTLHVHLVLQDMHPGSSEEIMYRSLMKWSNSHVPELESLQERLLCVELSETSVHLVITVMKRVTSIAPIVSFLPLANRICIEMSEPRGVKQVMEKISRDITSTTSHVSWCKVRRVQPLCSEHLNLKRRLQEYSEITINLDQGISDVDVFKPQPPPSEASEKTTQPSSQGAAKLPQVVPASKAASATQTPQTSSQNLAATESNAKLNQTAANTLNVLSKSSSEKQPDASGKGEESSVEPQDTNCSSEAKGEEPVDAKPSPVKPASGPSQGAQTTLKTSVKASSEAQEPIKPNPESTPQELKTKTVTSLKELQTAGSSDIVETERNPSKADKKSSAETKSTKQSAAAGGQAKPDPTTDSAPGFFLTLTETIPQLNAAELKLCQRHLIPQVSLSNKICVEKSEPGGVKQAMEKIPSPPVDRLHNEFLSLKRRLQACSEVTIKLDQGTKDIHALTSGPPPSEASEKTKQPAGEEPVDTKPSPASLASEPSQRPQTTSVKASSEAQEPIKPNPESSPTTRSAPVIFLTPREKIPQLRAAAKRLYQRSLRLQVIMSNKLLSMLISLVITKLPEFNNSCYTEADIINLLHKYDIQCENDKLFIIPEARMAFVYLPDVEKVHKFFKESKFRNVLLKGSKLFFSVISISNSTPLGFYTFLKSLVGFSQRITDPTKVIYIQNISQCEVSDLWKSVKRVGRVMNYLPLLNKVFIEFVDIWDADRIGVCYSFLKQRFPYSISRMGLPRGFETSKAPRQPRLALPHRSISTSRATLPTAPSGIPEGTIAPFWVTMTTSPYVFPTVSPWFNIPAIFTVRNIQHVKEQQLAKFPVIMLTGLPNEAFTHEDVAMLVWKYLPEQNLYSLYHDVVVLPLQRRAFVHFQTWAACFKFLQDHLRNPVSLKNCALYIHIVLNVIQLRSHEEDFYKILMKWSNVHVPDLKSLEERLLCVEVSGMNERLVSTVMKEVASIATFVSFLPLANRIYIEMAESSGVRKVVENLSVSTLSEQCETWKQVGRIESLKSRKLHLQDCRKIAVNLEQAAESTVESSASSDKKTPETSSHDSPGSTVCEPARAEPSGTATKEESTEVTVCSTVDAKSGLKAAEKKKEESVPSCPLPSRSQVQPHEEAADLPSVNMDHFRALKEAINQYKLSKEAQEDTEDVRSSVACVQPVLKFEDLVTIDKINEDVEDKDIDNSSSSLKQISREKREDHGLDPSSSSSRSTGTSPPVESQKHSPAPNKSQTNPLSSASDSKASLVTSSSKSVETHVSPGQEAQPSKATPRTPKPGKMSEEKLMDEECKGSDEKGKNKENYQTVDSRDGQTDEQINHENNTETQIPGPEKDQVLQQGGLQVSDGAEAAETCNETKTKASVENKHNATDDKSAKEKKHLVKDGGSTVKTDQTRVSEMEENQNSQLKQDRSLTGDRETVKDNKERVSEDPVQGDSVSKRSVRRSTRGTKDQTTTQDKFTSVEPTIMTRSTRGRRKITANEIKEKETPMKPRRTPVRDLKKPNKEDSPKTKDITTTKNINTRDSCESQTSEKTSEDFKETEEKKQEAPTPKKRGRPRKDARLPTPVPVRKSTRGINLESPHRETRKRGVEDLKEGCSLDEKNVLNKRKMKLAGPEAKRSRSQSPRIPADVKLPPFSPEKPLGKEFVSRKWGYYCHLCSVSYLDEGATKDQHCSSQTHRENLQKYHQKLRQKPSRISTQNSQ